MRDSVTTVLALLQPGQLVPCRITQVTPVLVTIGTTANVAGEKLAGATYAVSATDNNAYALIKPGKPLILPIG